MNPVALSVQTFILVVAAIIFIGFAGNWLLSKKGIPQTLFLIAAGVATRWSGILPSATVDSLLPLLSQVTLAMVVFDIGMSLRVHEVVSQGRSAILRSTLYMFLSILLVTASFPYLFHWALYQSLFLGSIVGGEVSMVVVPYLAKHASREDLISNLAIESVFDSLVLIILFFVLLTGYTQNAPLDLQGVTLISATFFAQVAVGLVGGAIGGFAWLRFTKLAGQSDYFYLATVGYVLLAFALVNKVGGSGVITVLTIGLMMKNTPELPSWLGLDVPLPSVLTNYISAFQTEISFFLRTFFLFFLGFSVPTGVFADPQVYLPFADVIGILLLARYLTTEAVDGDRPPRDRRFIELMMAQGLTPALLATTLVANSVAGADQILPITALVIVATNAITSLGVRQVKRMGDVPLASLLSATPLARELSGITSGLEPAALEGWRKKIEQDAIDAAPQELKEVVALPQITGLGQDSRELKVSRRALPYLVAAIEKNKGSMPEGARTYFETLEDLLTRGL